MYVHFSIKIIVQSSKTNTFICFQTEQIRRANRLWTNDSLFLRETLLVPIPSDTVSCSSQSNSHSVSEASTPSETETLSSCSTNNNGLDSSDNSYNDFLCKIDCSIANTRSQVMLAQGNSE